MRIRRALVSELDIALFLRRQAATWLASKATDQWMADWPDTDTMIAGFYADLQAGTTWFAINDHGHILGCITVNDTTAGGLWAPDEESSALFVHRLTVNRVAAGWGVGARLLDHAGELAEVAGRTHVRLDAWTTNTRLHAWYESQGFQLVRVVSGHHTPSAACFERPATVRMHRAPPGAGALGHVCDFLTE